MRGCIQHLYTCQQTRFMCIQCKCGVSVVTQSDNTFTHISSLIHLWLMHQGTLVSVTTSYCCYCCCRFRLSEPQVLRVIGSVLLVMLSMCKNLTHNDTKGSNIFLGPDGKALVGDFGMVMVGEEPNGARRNKPVMVSRGWGPGGKGLIKQEWPRFVLPSICNLQCASTPPRFSMYSLVMPCFNASELATHFHSLCPDMHVDCVLVTCRGVQHSMQPQTSMLGSMRSVIVLTSLSWGQRPRRCSWELACTMKGVTHPCPTSPILTPSPGGVCWGYPLGAMC